MDQSIINWIFGAFSTVMGFLFHMVWNTLKDLQMTDARLSAKVADIQVLVAGDYLRRDEFCKTAEAMFLKLDKIEDKLNSKADRKP